MKKMTLKNKTVSVTAEFDDEESLSTVLFIVEGMIKSMGYCFDGKLEMVG